MKTNNLDRLIKILCDERGESVPPLDEKQKPDYFRALCNVRPPMSVSVEFLSLQDEYLTERKNERGVVDVKNLAYADGISLFKGDITTLSREGFEPHQALKPSFLPVAANLCLKYVKYVCANLRHNRLKNTALRCFAF